MKTCVLFVAFVLLVPLSALAQTLISFNGGIGVDPVAGTTGTAPDLTPTQNVVRSVDPPGDPWRIESLRARVDTSGNIKVLGSGLLLAGGNGIGTTGVVSNVVAELFCGAAATATEFDSAAAPLDAQGDFSISSALSAQPPDPCTDPVLLIAASTSSGPGPWLAAGFPQ
jgi:hypothetical protein